jgi:hypothetical protein
MGEERGRLVNRAGADHTGEEFRRRPNQPSGNPRGGKVRGLLGALVTLGLGIIAAVPAKAQDTPAKNDAAAKSERARESAPESPPQEPASAEALSLHYRFLERYSATEDPNHPELLTQYRVGLVETQKAEREKLQGAPDRYQMEYRTIYTERTAQATKLGELTSAVRRYDRFRRQEIAAATPSPKVPWFEGLTIIYKAQSGRMPLILNLGDDRPLREFEYSEITRQVFLPRLTVLLPQTPKLVGDTWPIPAKAAECLVGEMPSPDGFAMSGNLLEVRKSKSDPTLTAVIGITGDFTVSHGPSSLNAELLFTFNPVAPVPPPSNSGASAKAGDSPDPKGGPRPNAGIVNARGFISGIRMAWTATNRIPAEEGRLKLTKTYELRLERKLDTAPADAGAGGPQIALVVPQPIPTATESNSWVLYQDPQERFYLLHPQSLKLSPEMVDPNVLELVEQDHGAGKDVFLLTLAPGAAEPQADKEFRDVNQFQRKIDAYWAKMKEVETIRGPAGWLPEAEWAPWKVFRKELGVRAGGRENQGKAVERIYRDDYLVLSKRSECFHVTGMTIRDDHVAFRTQTEGIIKSFHFGKWDPQAKAPDPASAPPLTPSN